MSDHVWLKNPETGGVWACPAVLADQYRTKRGWVDTDTPDEDQATLDKLGDAAQTDVFDPADHSVVEVQSYLDANAASPEETERVLAAERDGKSRKSILGDPAV